MSKTIILAIFALTAFTVNAQDEGFIYGKVTTIDGESFTGQIRWGKEEAYWTDLFNGTKEDNENYRYLSRDERDDLRDRGRRDRGWSSNWNVRWGRDDWEVTHEFQARFGDIARIDIKRKSEVELTLRNGDQIYVQDGSNDFGAEIRVMDGELGVKGGHVRIGITAPREVAVHREEIYQKIVDGSAPDTANDVKRSQPDAG